MGKFNLLEKLLPPEETIFYSCFEKASEVCCDSAKLFNKIALEGINTELADEARELKHKANTIYKEVLAHLNSTFITPIDREDIQEVSFLLRRITKKITRACVYYNVYNIETSTDKLKEQSETLLMATKELKFGISKLKKVSQEREVIESNQRMRDLEVHGDEIIHDAIKELFSGEYDALSVMKLRDTHKNLETALDVCFNVSDQVVNIVLKHG